MDICISLRAANGCLVSAAQSFNNHGPIQGDWRLIGEEETWLTDGQGLRDHRGNDVPLPEGPSGWTPRTASLRAIARGARP